MSTDTTSRTGRPISTRHNAGDPFVVTQTAGPAPSTSCCPTDVQRGCCTSQEKAACCGAVPESGTCRCQS